MEKILFLKEKDRNAGQSLEHGDYRYKTAKPVTGLKPKRDEAGFTSPYAMFRPIRESGLLCELLGDNPVRRTADLKMNFDFLVKDLYENEVSRLMHVVRLEELRCRLIFSSEDRAWERYSRQREKGQQATMPKVTPDESRKAVLNAIIWKYDWIQQHKKQCFRFAEAVYARQTKGETSQVRFIEAFIQYANLKEQYAWNAFYAPHRRAHDPLHNDDCIYTPGVMVFKSDTDYPQLLPEEKWYSVNVLTCAAPNLRERTSNGMNAGDGDAAVHIGEKKLQALHEKRIHRVLDIAWKKENEVVILGAFGCGAFRNPPTVVAQAMKTVVQEYRKKFETIEFAVYCSTQYDTNYRILQQVLGGL